MKNLMTQHELWSLKAKKYMEEGQITQYFEALLQIHKYKRLLIAITAN